MLIPAAAGAALATALLIGRRRFLPGDEVRFWSRALVVAALVYVVLALVAGTAAAIVLETLGLALFLGLALIGRSAALIGIGWIAHVAWDVGLHTPASTPWVPALYPQVCVGFDLLVAGTLLLSRRRRAADRCGVGG